VLSSRILRDHTPDIRPLGRMMRWSPLHGDMQWTSSKEVMSSSDVSE